MNESRQGPAGAGIPVARRVATRWPFSIVWVVPAVAAVLAGYLFYDRVRELGPTITIRFKDASGLRPGQTPIRYRGVAIGAVTDVELSEDQQHAVVRARLQRSAAPVAREGTVFWIVRPEVGIGNISGLGTVVTGPQIEALPGAGKAKSAFVGLETPPVALERKGLRIVLLSGHLGSLKFNSPVYYRGVEVGAVQDSSLSADATTVKVHVVIKRRYASLVRKGSKFWNASGVDMRVGLFRGLEINMESLRSLMAGGIAFATPDDPNDEPAKDGAAFPLHDKPKGEWLGWTPKIALPPDGRVSPP